MRQFLLVMMIISTSISIDAQTLTQEIKGRVLDESSQISLIGATVILPGTDPLIGTITNTEGYFKLSDVPLGRYDIQISYMGYNPKILPEILVNSGKQVDLTILLKESIANIEEVSVKAYKRKDQPMNSMAMLSARTFSIEETRRYAGGIDDPARMASSYAGVASGSLQDNSIIIRGNSPKGVLWRLEGVSIPNPNHFAGANVAGGGLVTIFSGQLMANSDFYTGAFPAEHGNALAGVFDMRLRNGNNEKYEFTFQAGTMGIDFASEGPFVKGKKASYLFNYRYSTFGLIKQFLPERTAMPAYQDLSFKLNFPTKKAGNFALWGIGAHDIMNFYERLDSTTWEREDDRMNMHTFMYPGAAGLSHKYLFKNNKTYIHTNIAATIYTGGFDQKWLDGNLSLQPDQVIRVSEWKYIVNSFVNHKFNSRHTNRTGIIYNKIFYDINLKAAPDYGMPLIQYVKSDGNSDLFQAYSHSKYDFSDNFSVSGGIHAMYFALNNKYSIEPRLSIQLALTNKHKVSAGYGLHSQMEDLKIYLARQQVGQTIHYPNKNLNFNKAHHFVLGYDWLVNDNLRLKVEPYYQSLYDVPVIPDSSYSMINFDQQWFFNDSLANTGTGTNLGIDLTLERFLNNDYYYLATLSLFDSKYKDGKGEIRDSRYNKNYVVNLLFGKEFRRERANKISIFGMSGRLTMMGGEHIPPVMMQKSLGAKNVLFDHTRAFESRANNRYIFDITFTYRKNKAKYSSVWAIQILNVLASSTDDYYYYSYDTKKIEKEEIRPVVPSISYKVEF